MSNDLKRTELYQWHVEHGGRMVPFAGWVMPVQYPTGPVKEHQATRAAAGLFDIDHMGQIEVRGPEAEAFVNWIVTYDVRKMKNLDAHYSLFCYSLMLRSDWLNRKLRLQTAQLLKSLLQS